MNMMMRYCWAVLVALRLSLGHFAHSDARMRSLFEDRIANSAARRNGSQFLRSITGHHFQAKNECIRCNLASVYVPPSVAWLRGNDTDFLEELGEVVLHPHGNQADRTLAPLRTYWARIEAAGLADMKGPTLHEACPLPFNAAGALLRLIEDHHHGGKAGAFLLFRGDSHMRIAFQQLVRSITAELDPLVAMNFKGDIGNTPAVHVDHLFCCASLPDARNNSSGLFTGCSVEAAGRDFVDMREAVASKILPRRRRQNTSSSSTFPEQEGSQGDHHAVWPVCIGLVFEVNFKDHGLLSHWLQHEGGAVAPSALIANGGAHYVPAARLGAEFSTDLTAWLTGTQQAMETQTASAESAALAAHTMESKGDKRGRSGGVRTRLILTSSPLNGYMEWEPQRLAYESMRRAVAASHPSASSSSKSRTSYLDLHALAKVDACGFSRQFPHRAYEVIQRDACGHHYHCSDLHLSGGAYVHFVELALNLAVADRRRCDPPPHDPPPPALLRETNQKGEVVETTAGGGGQRAAYLESLRGSQCNPFFGRCKSQKRDAIAALLQT